MGRAEGEQRPPELRTVTLQNGETLFESHLSLLGRRDRADGRRAAGPTSATKLDRPQRCEIDEERLTREFGDLYGGKQRLLIPRETSDGWFAARGHAPSRPLRPVLRSRRRPGGAEPSAADAASTADASPEGSAAELAQLAQLRDAGSLSVQEFAAAKARLLGQSPPG